MAAVTKYNNQFYPTAAIPLDATTQVDTYEDLLLNGDDKKVIPYPGKMVHVKNDHKYYICSSVIRDQNNKKVGVWTPIFAEDGTAFFLRDTAGNLYEITANEGRLEVTMTTPDGH